jgi:hypothetical protein
VHWSLGTGVYPDRHAVCVCWWLPTDLAQPFLPVVLALYHSIRHPSQRQYPAWSADARPKTLLERVVSFTYGHSTRYIVPSILLSISSFLVLIKTSALRSTYICPVSTSTATFIPTLQFVGFALDTVIVQLLYRLVDDGISPVDDCTIHLQDGTSNNLLIGLTLTASTAAAAPSLR